MESISKKYFYILVGWIWFLIGFIGIFLPILPTVPFMILAAFYFSKSSPRLHHWLLNLPYIGAPIKDWEKNHIIRRRTKILASFMLTLPASVTIILFQSWKLAIVVSSIIFVVLIFVWTRKSE